MNRPGLVEALIPGKGGAMPAPKKYPVELRERLIRLVEDLLVHPGLQLSVTGRALGPLSSWASTATRCVGGSTWPRSIPVPSPGCRPTSIGGSRSWRWRTAILMTASAFFASIPE
jgi:hypothetical protein